MSNKTTEHEVEFDYAFNEDHIPMYGGCVIVELDYNSEYVSHTVYGYDQDGGEYDLSDYPLEEVGYTTESLVERVLDDIEQDRGGM